MLPDTWAHLHDIAKSSDLIAEFTQGLSFEAYLADTKTRAAVERQFVTIGEAVRRIAKKTQTLRCFFQKFERLSRFETYLCMHTTGSRMPLYRALYSVTCLFCV